MNFTKTVTSKQISLNNQARLSLRIGGGNITNVVNPLPVNDKYINYGEVSSQSTHGS